MRIGVLGTGTIASAVVRGIAGDGHQIVVSERSAAHSAALAAEFANVTVADNQAVVDHSEVVFLGLMAEVARDILPGLQFREGQQVISFMAGATLNEAAALVAPARAVALMLPYPGIAHGGSPILMIGEGTLIAALFAARNPIFTLKDQAELDAYLCAQAVLSPIARMVDDTAGWLSDRVADAGQGEAFLRALVASSLAGMEAAPLIEALNTPGGYNQRLRLHMEAAGISEQIAAGLDKLERGW